MKLAVLSDIHGNLPALTAVLEEITLWGPDLLVVNGDLVSRGPYSSACMDLLLSAFPAARLLKGNHEEFVLENAGAAPEAGTPQFELTRFVRFCAAELGAERLARLAQWPDHLDLTHLDGGTLHVTHGSRLGSRAGIGAATPDEELPAKLGDPRDLFIASHTHKPLLRQFGATHIVNVGSVGTPMDDDVRAAWGAFTYRAGRWQVELRRVAYDRAQARRDFDESGFLEAGGVFARMILAEFIHARALAGRWMWEWHAPVLAGEIGVVEAVRRHLEAHHCADALAR